MARFQLVTLLLLFSLFIQTFGFFNWRPFGGFGHHKMHHSSSSASEGHHGHGHRHRHHHHPTRPKTTKTSTITPTNPSTISSSPSIVPSKPTTQTPSFSTNLASSTI
uniref:Candidate secreted effector n=1 Tax=Meloidogyne incognita TaxID=6306 RepID=A0A914L0R7_MELIC